MNFAEERKMKLCIERCRVSVFSLIVCALHHHTQNLCLVPHTSRTHSPAESIQRHSSPSPLHTDTLPVAS
eukprot:5004-Eustigmatos_ZCMA.PRE.1